MLVGPGVQVKPVKGDALHADGNFGQVRPHDGAENLAIHAEVGWRVAHADEAGIHRMGHICLHGYLNS